MAKKYYDGEVTMNTNWGGDESTGNLPVIGSKVQEFIKENLKSKVGYLGTINDVGQPFYVLTRDKVSFDAYKETVTVDRPNGNTDIDGFIGRFNAPFTHELKIELGFSYKSTLIGSTGNNITIKASVVDKDDNPTNENISVTVKVVTEGGVETSQTVVYDGLRIANGIEYNLDGKLSSGMNSIIVSAIGMSSNMSGVKRASYRIIDMYFNDTFEINKSYTINENNYLGIEIPYSLKGVGNTVINWYVDGGIMSNDNTLVLPTKTTKITKVNPNISNSKEVIEFSNTHLSCGVHTLQIQMICTDNSSGEEFKTPIYYREFIIDNVNNPITDKPYIVRKTTLTKDESILSGITNLPIYDAKQYYNSTLEYAVFYKGKGSCKVITSEKYGYEEQTVISDEIVTLSNSFSDIKKQTINFTQTGLLEISLNALNNSSDGENYIAKYSTTVLVSDINVSFVTDNLILDLNALGRSNDSSDKDKWEYTYKKNGALQTIETIFSTTGYAELPQKPMDSITGYTGNTLTVDTVPETENKDYKYLLCNGKYYIWEREFDWSNTSGWYNDKLRLSNGNSITINYAPFANGNFSSTNGGTFEFEFETTNVYNDDAIICQICSNKDYAPGITIYASGAELVISREIVEPEYDDEGNQINVNAGYIQSVSTKFKSEENNRISFVITPNNTTESGYRNRLIKIYVNGELCGAYPYESDTNFFNDSFITFRGTSDACVNISSVQIYDNALSSSEILGNYIYLRNSTSEKVEIFKRNDIISDSSDDNFDKDKLSSQIPIMTFYQIERVDDNGNTIIDSLDDIHQETKNKKLTRFFDVVYEDVQHPENNFLIKNAYVTPQGTSSMNYPVKNLRLYTGKKNDKTKEYYSRLFVGKNIFKDNNPNNRLTKEEFEKISANTTDIETWNVNEESEVKDKKRRHQFKTGSAPVNCWCLKADFAESSSSHNTGTARYWNEVLKSNGLLTKAQQKSKQINYEYDVRTAIDGFPIVVFYQELNNDAPRFEGKYNFNNDKSTEDVFGFTGGKELTNQEFKYFYIGKDAPIIHSEKDETTGDIVYACSFERGGYIDAPDEDSPLYVSKYLDDGTEEWYMLRGNTHLDNPKMECWEILNSVNDLALFKTIDGFTTGDGNEKVGIITKNDKGEDVFEEAFESRYPDCGDYYHTNSLKTFCNWLVSCRYLDYDKTTGESIYFNNQDFISLKTSNKKITIQSLTRQEKSIKFEQPGANLYQPVDYSTIQDKIYNDSYKEIDPTEVTVDEKYILSIYGAEVPSKKQTGYTEDIDGQEIEIEYDYIKLIDSSNQNVKFYIWTISNLLVTDTLPETHQVSYDFVLVTSDKKYYKWNNMIDLKNYHEPQTVEDTQGNRALKFAVEKYDHIEMDKMAAYYIYLMRFGGVDQTVKNAMLTTEGPASDDPNSKLPSLWYFINYDNDTILGVKNDGRLVFDPYITRQTFDGTGFAYAGRESTLWNNLELDVDFMEHVNKIDNQLTKGEQNKNYALSYSNAIREYDTDQSDKWCERIYNKDAERKYIDTYVEGWTQSVDKDDTHTQVYEDYLYDVHGSRSSHRKWWIGRRFNIFDSKFCNSNFMNYLIKFRSTNLAAGSEFSIKSGEPIYYAWGHDNNITEMTKNVVKPGEIHTFKTNSAFNIGSYLELYGAPNIITLDLRKSAGAITELDITKCNSVLVGTKLKELLLGDHTDESITNSGSQLKLSGLNIAKKLEVLDMTNVKNVTAFDGLNTLLNIKEVYAKGTRVSSLVFAEGAMIEKLTLPTTLKTLELNKCPLINSSNIEINNDVYNNLQNLTIKNCKQLMSNFNFVYNWLNNKSENEKRNLKLNLIGIDWEFESYDYQNFKIFEGIGDIVINGKIKINQELDITQVEKLKTIFGNGCFDKDSALQIIADPKIYITLPDAIWRGSERIEGIITKVGINDVINTDLSFTIFNGTNAVNYQNISNVDVSDLNNGKFYVTINESNYEYNAINILVSVTAKINYGSYETTVTYDETKNCIIKERIYPTGVTFIPHNLSLNSYVNTLSLSYESEGTEDLNDINLDGRGYFTVTWRLSGSNFNGKLYFNNSDGTTGTTTYGESVTLINNRNNIFEGNITITITVKPNYTAPGDNSKTLTISSIFEIISPETILTKKSNEAVYNILKNKGLIKELNGFGKLTKTDASNIQLSDLIVNGVSIFNGNTEITTFNEFAYFTHNTIGSTTGNTLTNGFFQNCVNLKEITFNKQIKYCGNDIFNGCKSLHSIYGWNNTNDNNGNPIKSEVGLVKIGSGFTQNCESLTTIGTNNSLSNCTNIGKNAFYNCKNLRYLSINSSTNASISYDAFIGCHNITFAGSTYNVGNDSSKYQINDGALYERNTNSLTLIHLGRNSKISNMPYDTLSNGKTIEVIAKSYSMECRNVFADENSKEMDIIVKDNVIFNGEFIFKGSIGNKIELTRALSTMPKCDYLFESTNFNWNYKFADNETLIPNRCFNSIENGTYEFIIQEGIKEIGEQVFYSTSINRIVFPSTIEKIGTHAFWLTNGLSEVVFKKLKDGLPPPIVNGNDAFFGNKIENIYVDPLDYYMFKNTNNNGSAFEIFKAYLLPSHLYAEGSVRIISNGEVITDTNRVTVGSLKVSIDSDNPGYLKYNTNGEIITDINVKLDGKIIGFVLNQATTVYDSDSDNSSLISAKTENAKYYNFTIGLGSVTDKESITGSSENWINEWVYDQRLGGIINKNRGNCELQFPLYRGYVPITYGMHAYTDIGYNKTYGYVRNIHWNKDKLDSNLLVITESTFNTKFPGNGANPGIQEPFIIKMGYTTDTSTRTGFNSIVINSLGEETIVSDPQINEYSTLLLSDETEPTIKSINVKLYAPVEIPDYVYVTIQEENNLYTYRKYYNNDVLNFIVPNKHNFTASAIDFTTIEGKEYTLRNTVKVDSDNIHLYYDCKTGIELNGNILCYYSSESDWYVNIDKFNNSWGDISLNDVNTDEILSSSANGLQNTLMLSNLGNSIFNVSVNFNGFDEGIIGYIPSYIELEMFNEHLPEINAYLTSLGKKEIDLNNIWVSESFDDVNAYNSNGEIVNKTNVLGYYIFGRKINSLN